MFVQLVLLAFICGVRSKDDPDRWWRAANVYQVSPVAFKDSDNDGFGDIRGIIDKLDYIVETGFDVIFLAPFYPTPFKDFAYDISSYVDVEPRFGTMKDLDELFEKAKGKGLRIIIDFVPNHSSNENEWFVKSENNDKGYENFYIWSEGIPMVSGNRKLPPNNWQSVYGGPSWQWSEMRQSYYYHAFAVQQPDLNLREPQVIEELEKILEFWLLKGADGFRVDAVSRLYEDPTLQIDPDVKSDLPETYELVARFRKFIDNFTATHGGDNRILVPQVWDAKLDDHMRYYQSSQIPTNFGLINKLNRDSTADDYKTTIDSYLQALPDGAVPNWFVSIFSMTDKNQSQWTTFSSAHMITRELHREWEL